YTKVGPNEVLIISGRRARKDTDGKLVGYRIVRGGGTYVRPFREKVQRLSLELMQFDVRTGETYSMHGVPLQVDGVCMVRVDPSDRGIQVAAEEFLSRGRDDIARTAQQAVEGHLRAAVGAHSIEDVYRERAKLVDATKSLSGPDLGAMGLEIVSLTIRQITDKQGYLEALGRPRTAQVKRDAVRLRGMAEAEAMMAKAGAWGKYNEAAIADRLLSILPELAAAVSAPLSKTEKIVMIGGGGNGDGIGAHRVTRDVMKIVAELP